MEALNALLALAFIVLLGVVGVEFAYSVLVWALHLLARLG